MRRIVMFNHVSADGSFSDAQGSFAFAKPDDELDKDAMQGSSDIDTLLLGRKTYDTFESFWPHALDQDPHRPGRKSESLAAMANFINNNRKIVFSRSKRGVTWKNSELIHDFDPDQIQAMKAGPGKDMIVFGSGHIVSLLTQHQLIDEYTFIVGPLLLGSSRPPITGLTQSLKLDLLEVKRYGSGNVKLRYALAKQS